ncbi:MAG: MarR family winged helix-turn-helix transcriptional regulator [Coriobacteriia bacterium]|nr:MarR family winged helix-turn-helix transcriptional regulator [Coriobacteriia bacterium]
MSAIDTKLLTGLHRNVASLDRKTAQLAAEYDLTLGQFAVLEVLYSKGKQSISRVRDRILSSVGTIPVIVKNLESRDLIERLDDEHDKRVCILNLTEKGEQLIGELAPKNLNMIHEVFSVLSDEEKLELSRLLKKIGRIEDAKDNY